MSSTRREADIKKAAEIDPADHENFAVLANVYLFQDNYAQAIDALSKAIDAYKPEKRGDPEIFVAGYTLRADANLKLAEKEKDAKKAEAYLKCRHCRRGRDHQQVRRALSGRGPRLLPQGSRPADARAVQRRGELVHASRQRHPAGPRRRVHRRRADVPRHLLVLHGRARPGSRRL